MEINIIFASAITFIFMIYIVGQFFSLERSKFKTSEANRVLNNLANTNTEPSALASVTSTQGLTFVRKRKFFSKSKNNHQLITQSKPTGIGWA